MSEEDLKRLAEAKAFLERRIGELEAEVANLRSLVEVVDVLLAERSFKKVKLPKAPEAEAPVQSIPIKTEDGVHLADLDVFKDHMAVRIDEGLKLDAGSPPLRAFLIGKVLDPLQAKDLEAVKAGEIPPDKAISYELDQEDGRVRGLIIRNYGTEKRLLELKNAIRWTLRRAYERSKV
ncbi:MAG: hypothetical protein QXU06_02055 [Candidatus Bathyarchaeia archaeon]